MKAEKVDTSPPLTGHRLFHSRDLNEARERVGQVFCAHDLQTNETTAVNAWHHHVRWHHVSLNYISYGAEVQITPNALKDFYLLQMPLKGGAKIDHGPYEFCSDERRAVVFNPHFPLSQRWYADSEHFLLQVDGKALQAHAQKLIGTSSDVPLTFTAEMDIKCPKASGLRQMILFILSEVDQGRMTGGNFSLMAPHMEEVLMSGLIDAVPNNYIELVGATSRDISPRKLRRAEEFICENLRKHISLNDIADAAETTPRNLQHIFKEFRGTTPMQFLRERRLNAARTKLMASDDGVSVTGVAVSCGFTHLGRFSTLYRKTYGETPSTTLDHSLKSRRAFCIE